VESLVDVVVLRSSSLLSIRGKAGRKGYMTRQEDTMVHAAGQGTGYPLPTVSSRQATQLSPTQPIHRLLTCFLCEQGKKKEN
jgi:hypothetical protein